MPEDATTERPGKAGGLIWIWLSVAIFVADQATKTLASTYLVLHNPVPVLPFFNLTLVHNTGVAFSFLSNAGDLMRWVLVLVALLVSVVVFFWLKRLPPDHKVTAAGLSLILGGAIGNVWDRILYGHVVDFVDLHVGGWHWPAFNIADSAITIGAVLLILDMLRGERDPDRST